MNKGITWTISTAVFLVTVNLSFFSWPVMFQNTWDELQKPRKLFQFRMSSTRFSNVFIIKVGKSKNVTISNALLQFFSHKWRKNNKSCLHSKARSSKDFVVQVEKTWKLFGCRSFALSFYIFLFSSLRYFSHQRRKNFVSIH